MAKEVNTMGDRIKEGITLIIVDSNGVQLFSRELGDWNAWDYESQRELGQSIAEGLPEEAYKPTEEQLMKSTEETLKPGVYESFYGNAISWDGESSYDLDAGEDVPFGVIVRDHFIRPLD